MLQSNCDSPEDQRDSAPGEPLPLISVIVPAFNAAGHIGPALDSVVAQTFFDYEIIVVNDGSPDHERFEQVLKPYLARITYLTRENGGPSAARNTGIRQARGEWVAFLDSDDVWLPTYLEKQMQFLNSDPTLDMAYCNALLQGEGLAAGRTYMDVCPSIGRVTFESLLIEESQVLTSGTVARRQMLISADLFDENLRCSEDHDLWLRMLHAGAKISYHREALVRRRVRTNSQGASPGALLAGEIQSLKKLQHDLDLTPRRRDLIAHRLRTIQALHAVREGKTLLLEGSTDKAYQLFKRAYTLAPSSRLRAILIGLKVAPRLAVMSARFWRRRTPSLRQA